MGRCCERCFDDPCIAQFIKSLGEKGTCEYCGHSKVWTGSTAKVGKFIRDGLLACYEDANDSMPYDSEEEKLLEEGNDVLDILIEIEEVFAGPFLKGVDERVLAEDLMEDSGPSEYETGPTLGRCRQLGAPVLLGG